MVLARRVVSLCSAMLNGQIRVGAEQDPGELGGSSDGEVLPRPRRRLLADAERLANSITGKSSSDERVA